MRRSLRTATLAVASILLSTNVIYDAFAVSSTPAAVCVGESCTLTLVYTGDYYAWTVPSSVSTITFNVQGAQGGTTTFAGGLGGRVTGTLAVTPSSTLYFYVGGAGAVSAAGGWNGGGNATGINHGGSGGGGSDIRTVIGDWNSRLVVAGGGGGASGGSYPNVGGAGGGLIGGDGPTNGSYTGGKGGTQSAGGAGGTGYCSPVVNGAFGVGGGSTAYHCPAGGGGWYGGGRGAVMGGGGGSSYTDPTFVTGAVHTQGLRSGNGLITITYTGAPPTITTSIAGNVKSVSKGQTIQLNANVDQAGKVTFFADGKRIPGCIGIVASVGNVQCNWKPTGNRSIQITAVISQNGIVKTVSSGILLMSGKRTNKR